MNQGTILYLNLKLTKKRIIGDGGAKRTTIINGCFPIKTFL
jgi:hypothetical protein